MAMEPMYPKLALTGDDSMSATLDPPPMSIESPSRVAELRYARSEMEMIRDVKG
jgi:hypothetical protein